MKEDFQTDGGRSVRGLGKFNRHFSGEIARGVF